MHITYEMVREDIPAFIAEKGDNFIYSIPSGANGTCRYVWDGEPSCLIGRYLVSLGLPLEAFEIYEGTGIDNLFSTGAMERHGFTADPEAIMAMSSLQDLQDNSVSWGNAYRRTFE